MASRLMLLFLCENFKEKHKGFVLVELSETSFVLYHFILYKIQRTSQKVIAAEILLIDFQSC